MAMDERGREAGNTGSGSKDAVAVVAVLVASVAMVAALVAVGFAIRAVDESSKKQTTLAAGHYVMVCNLPGHYLAGMHTSFTVTGTPEVGSVVPAPPA